MKKLTDKELDSLFVNASENYAAEYNPETWDTMLSKLESKNKSNGWSRKLIYISLGVLLFGSGIFTGLYINENRDNVQLTQTQHIISKTPAKSDYNNPINSINTEVIKSDDSISRRGIAKLKSLNEGASLIVFNDQYADNKFSELKSLSAVDIDSAITQSPLKEQLIIPTSQTDFDSLELAYKKEQVPDSVAKKNDSDESKVAYAPIFIRALVSPDFSSLNFASTDLVGTNYSIQIEYSLNDRFSISAGAILSKKVYASNNEIVYGRYTADGVTASCKVLDLPINFYYKLYQHNRFTFFTGLGVSSYIMLKEEYTFYKNTSRGKREFDWLFKSENNQWFSMLNASVVGQYRVNKRLFIQAEPFVKVPLKGVGEWSLNLSSFGFFAGLKYQLNK